MTQTLDDDLEAQPSLPGVDAQADVAGGGPVSEAGGADVETDDEADDETNDGLVPYGADFTPKTLGKTLGEDNVLGWLLEQAKAVGTRGGLQALIVEHGMAHVEGVEKNKRDMASRVVAALQHYLLTSIDDDDKVTLTPVGATILDAPNNERDRIFGKHVLSHWGYRLIEAIERRVLRGETPTMELLNEELGQHPTSKNISTLRAWLVRAGVLAEGRSYAVLHEGLKALVGPGVLQLLGLTAPEVEFLLAARVLSATTGTDVLEAADVRTLATTRAPDVRLPSKALGSFVARLAERGLVEAQEKIKGKGGSRVAFKLALKTIAATDEQIRDLLKQSQAGFVLSELGSLAEVLAIIAEGNTDELGRAGERLAVHICLMLRLKVIGWRKKLPVEVDLTAERSVGFSYQRWHVQVKNVDGDVSSDRIDREIGAAAGTGATHLLFVCPRGGISSAARLEVMTKSRHTPLHIFWLSADQLRVPDPIALIRALEGQQMLLEREKRNEAERRERL